MELLLNIVWVLVATGVFGMWRAHWVTQRRWTRRDSLREWTAIAVALVLLFFAVSMTDDLHHEMALSEESATSRRNLSVSVGPFATLHSGLARHPSCLAIVTNLSRSGPSLVFEKPGLLVTWPVSDLLNDRSSGRAPPLSYL
jgi:hypothetical protein